jgi:uncharacterized membrane protein YhaH (DUF805 family)
MGQVDFNKLWQNFMDVVTNHYMDFAGRVGRAQYWFFILVCVGVLFAAAIVDAVVRTGLLLALINLALLLPIAGMSARRMQDTGRNGQLVWVWVIIVAITSLFTLLISLSPFGALGLLIFYGSIGSLLALVELAASIAIIYFCAQPGVAGDNAYGPPPAPWTPGPAAV